MWFRFLLFILILICIILPGVLASDTPSITTPVVNKGESSASSVSPAVSPARDTSTTSSRIVTPGYQAVSGTLPRTSSDVITRPVQAVAATAVPSPNSTPVRNETVNETPLPPISGAFVPGELIIRYNQTKIMGAVSTMEMGSQVMTATGATVRTDLSSSSLPGLQLINLPDNMSVEDAINTFEQNPSIDYAEPNYIITLDDPVSPGNVSVSAVTPVTPNDPYFSSLWGLQSSGDHDIDAPEAWNLSTGSQDVIVAVVDTGVQYNHPDLSANMWRDSNGYYGYDYYNNDNNPYDDNGHGTHCAGTIGGVGNNGVGVTGVNWNVKIMALKFLGSGGSGSTADAISAINYANTHGADVISNSWGGGSYSQSLKDVIAASSAVVVCAAGNDASNTASYPAAYDCSNIISVAASDSSDNVASFSNYHATLVDVAAPGSSILSTYPTSRYEWLSGTSMATPHVSGLAALIKSRNQSLTNAEIKEIILNTVDPLPQWSGKVLTGGRINAHSALHSARPPLEAKFYGVPGTEILPYSVRFYDASEGSPTEWEWDFGDSTTSSEQNPPVHTYTSPGSYTVTLTVSRD